MLELKDTSYRLVKVVRTKQAHNAEAAAPYVALFGAKSEAHTAKQAGEFSFRCDGERHDGAASFRG